MNKYNFPYPPPPPLKRAFPKVLNYSLDPPHPFVKENYDLITVEKTS